MGVEVIGPRETDLNYIGPADSEGGYKPVASAEDGARYKIPAFVNLTAQIDYRINRHFSVYLKGENLLGNKNWRYAGIMERPLNAGGGIAINF